MIYGLIQWSQLEADRTGQPIGSIQPGGGTALQREEKRVDEVLILYAKLTSEKPGVQSDFWGHMFDARKAGFLTEAIFINLIDRNLASEYVTYRDNHWKRLAEYLETLIAPLPASDTHVASVRDRQWIPTQRRVGRVESIAVGVPNTPLQATAKSAPRLSAKRSGCGDRDSHRSEDSADEEERVCRKLIRIAAKRYKIEISARNQRVQIDFGHKKLHAGIWSIRKHFLRTRICRPPILSLSISREHALRDADKHRMLLRANGWMINFKKDFRSP